MILQFYKMHFTKQTIGIFFISLVLYFLSYMTFKTNLFIESSEYINTYINYYVNEYLNGDFSLLHNGLFINLVIEEDMQNLLSAEYIYKLSHFTVPFISLMIFTPFFVFYITSNSFFSDLNENASINYIVQSGRKRFYYSKVVSCIFAILTIVLLPRMIYLLCIICFFNVGFSSIHNLESTLLSYQVIDFASLNSIYIESLILDIITLTIYALTLFLVSFFTIYHSKSRKISLIYYFLFLFVWYFLYETFTYAVDSKYLYWPDLFNQFSFYRFAESLPTRMNVGVIFYQLLCVVFMLIFVIHKLRKGQNV